MSMPQPITLHLTAWWNTFTRSLGQPFLPMMTVYSLDESLAVGSSWHPRFHEGRPRVLTAEMVYVQPLRFPGDFL